MGVGDRGEVRVLAVSIGDALAGGGAIFTLEGGQVAGTGEDIADLAVYTRVSTALKKQLLAAVPHTYLQELEDTDFGYLQVSSVTMLDHLMTTYGVITPQEQSDNSQARD